jgi:hypothetical protein
MASALAAGKQRQRRELAAKRRELAVKRRELAAKRDLLRDLRASPSAHASTTVEGGNDDDHGGGTGSSRSADGGSSGTDAAHAEAVARCALAEAGAAFALGAIAASVLPARTAAVQACAWAHAAAHHDIAPDLCGMVGTLIPRRAASQLVRRVGAHRGSCDNCHDEIPGLFEGVASALSAASLLQPPLPILSPSRYRSCYSAGVDLMLRHEEQANDTSLDAHARTVWAEAVSRTSKVDLHELRAMRKPPETALWAARLVCYYDATFLPAGDNLRTETQCGDAVWAAFLRHTQSQQFVLGWWREPPPASPEAALRFICCLGQWRHVVESEENNQQAEPRTARPSSLSLCASGGGGGGPERLLRFSNFFGQMVPAWTASVCAIVASLAAPCSWLPVDEQNQRGRGGAAAGATGDAGGSAAGEGRWQRLAWQAAHAAGVRKARKELELAS